MTVEILHRLRPRSELTLVARRPEVTVMAKAGVDLIRPAELPDRGHGFGGGLSQTQRL